MANGQYATHAVHSHEGDRGFICGRKSGRMASVILIADVTKYPTTTTCKGCRKALETLGLLPVQS